MEQKQLDEMDENFFAEEYIEEESLDEDFLDDIDKKEAGTEAAKSGKENPFASAVKQPAQPDKPKDKAQEKTAKMSANSAAQKTKLQKAAKPAPVRTEIKNSLTTDLKTELQKKEEKLMEEIVITPVKPAASVKEVKDAKEEKKEERIKEEKAGKKNIEKTSAGKTARYEEAAPRVNPWADEKKGNEFKISADNKVSGEGGLFKDVSTWKALTGITVILLLFSVFTQGFQFLEKTPISAPQLTLKEAETKTLSFVNENLLAPPFVAQIVKSAEVNNIYQFTLSVAGQTVDSYLTKDGKLFFPQGLDTAIKFGANQGNNQVANQNNPPSGTPPSGAAPASPANIAPVEDDAAADAAEKSPGGTPADDPSTVSSNNLETTQTIEVTISAKRWLFNPPVVTVKKNSKVVFNIKPENVDFTFALPQLGVQQEIRGQTKVTVTADKAGSFEYICSSCEEWRGMKGTLFVE